MTPEQERQARRDIIIKYARLYVRNGESKPLMCTPSATDHIARTVFGRHMGSAGKIIYPTREAAESAARAMTELQPTSPQRAAICPRAGMTHFHLTHDLPAERAQRRQQ